MRSGRTFYVGFRQAGGFVKLYPMKEFFRDNSATAMQYSILDKDNSHVQQRKLLKSNDWACIELPDVVVMVFKW